MELSWVVLVGETHVASSGLAQPTQSRERMPACGGRSRSTPSQHGDAERITRAKAASRTTRKRDWSFGLAALAV